MDCNYEQLSFTSKDEKLLETLETAFKELWKDIEEDVVSLLETEDGILNININTDENGPDMVTWNYENVPNVPYVYIKQRNLEKFCDTLGISSEGIPLEGDTEFVSSTKDGRWGNNEPIQVAHLPLSELWKRLGNKELIIFYEYHGNDREDWEGFQLRYEINQSIEKISEKKYVVKTTRDLTDSGKS